MLEEDGDICCTHCTGMAGLGEICTHVAAILFYLETLYRIARIKTPTEGPCNWIMSTFLKSAEYHSIKNIDFTSPKGKKRKLDETIDNMKSPDQLDATASVDSPVDIHKEIIGMELLFEKLSICGASPGVWSLVPPYSDNYVPKSLMGTFPNHLLNFIIQI